MSNARLKERVFKRLCAMKPQVVHIEYRLQSLRDFYIHTRVIDEDSGVYKIRLAFNLAAAQTRQNAVRLDQADARLRQANAVAIPKRELPADKIRIVKDRVKAICLIVGRVLVALCPEKRSAKTQIVVIDRRLQRRHV